MRVFSLLFLLLNSILSVAQNPVGIFSFSKDIGNPSGEGSAIYNQEDQSYTLSGAGYNIWFEKDEFHYLYNKIEGDFIITANFEFDGEGTDSHRKVGLMIRKSEDEDAAHASASLHGDGLTLLQWRESRGSEMRNPETQIFSPKSGYEILQLERKGNEIIMRAAHWGEPLQKIGSKNLPNLSGEVLVGLFINSHNEEVVETARAWNVRIDRPVADDYNPGEEGWLGCRLEILNVQNGMRNVIYEKNDRFEAPNWMPGGENLLFNMEGSLYTIPLTGGEPVKFDTGFADNLNNDHGISFDGKMIAISHHRDGLQGGGSTIYVLPIEGGTPQLVTEETPSYWHGWAPNNEEVVYVATREGNPTYDIYKKSIHGGEEIALTDTGEGEHVDGCEYSPDGEYIYYNGSASGTMQIWRMKPDGSNKEQLTFDARNDWFPHISPDGKWIAYISFPAEIPVNDHPSFKGVTLNLMPTSGGAPKVIAYLYGGQGTINVPSWSPDSRYIVFVSNSGIAD
ncbi:biopolymer transporter TolR [Christiangramia sp.]|uniref:TolB family protein n=1 Tax=Christiangramia sp. TaxID=1931228 RepID=UPI002623E80D|nr:biopolymer transporter TolR [Christiangramia sp.]